MKKVLALLLAFVMVLSLAACGGGGEAAKPDNSGSADNPTSNTTPDSAPADTSNESSGAKDTLNVAFSQDRGTLDPCYCIGYDVLNACRNMYEGLWEWTADGQQEWILATGIDFVSDTCWHIHLREGVKFTNGNPFTAEDAMFSIDKANHRTGEPDYLPYLDSMQVIDEYTLELNFTQYDLSYIYSMPSLMMFDAESYDEDKIALNPNGTGPYVLTNYVVNSEVNMTLKDAADYWGELPAIKNINFKLFTESSQITNAIVTGQIDVATVPLTDVEYVQDSGIFNVDIGNATYSMTRALYFNTSEYSQFANNVKARQAIAMAIDTQAILDIAYNGYGAVSALPCSSQCIDVVDSLKGYGVYGTGYDPEGAKALAEEAGIVGKTFTMNTNGTSDAIATAELIQIDLEAIGVHVEINNLDAGSWLSYAFDPQKAGDFFVDFTSEPSGTVCQALSCWYLYALGGGYITSNLEDCPDLTNAQMLELSNKAMSVADEGERAKNNEIMNKFVTDNMLWYSLVDQVSAIGYAKALNGFRIFMAGNVDYKSLSWN